MEASALQEKPSRTPIGQLEACKSSFLCKALSPFCGNLVAKGIHLPSMSASSFPEKKVLVGSHWFRLLSENNILQSWVMSIHQELAASKPNALEAFVDV